jgi:hypothetical protein
MQTLHRGQIANKLKYLRELRDKKELERLFKHGLISHSAYTFLEAHDLYEVHVKVCPKKPVQATADVMGMTNRRIRQILFGK